MKEAIVKMHLRRNINRCGIYSHIDFCENYEVINLRFAT